MAISELQDHLLCCHQLQFNAPNLFVTPAHEAACRALQLGGKPLERVRVTINLAPSRLHHLAEAIQLQPEALKLEALPTN